MTEKRIFKMTKKLIVGSVPVGGGTPVTIQSMCNTKTDQVDATVAQIHALEAAGCEIIRIAVPDEAAAMAVDRIKEQITIPLIADIHFNYKLAPSGESMPSESTPATSVGRSGSRLWRRLAAESGFPFVSVSMAVLWKRACGPSMAALLRRHWWRAPWAM